MKKKVIIILLVVFAGLSVGAAEVYLFLIFNEKHEDAQEESIQLDNKNFTKFEKSHFGFMHPEMTYPLMEELNVHWERPHPGPFLWGTIEKEKGEYDWEDADNWVKRSQEHNILILATIWPYAQWDQAECHSKLPGTPREDFPELGDYRQIPCDMNVYSDFIEELVERYDGDGEDDMPNLKYPIKYWEVLNEPELSVWEDNELIFFWGENLADEYLEILKISYQAIKQSDRNAYVLNSGMAGLGGEEWDFWADLFSNDGAKYLDILSYHSVSGTSDLGLISLTELMETYSLDQSIWITEVQFGMDQMDDAKDSEDDDTEIIDVERDDFNPHNLSEEEWSEYLVKAFVQAYARGADKLFYIGLNSNHPGEDASALTDCEDADLLLNGEVYVQDNLQKKDKKEEPEDLSFDTSGCTKQQPFYAFATLVEMIDYFEKAEKIDKGLYKFTLQAKTVYVLWGDAEIPAKITGNVEVTDMYGNSTLTDIDDLEISEEPVYIVIQ